jgi:hypothetical protein
MYLDVFELESTVTRLVRSNYDKMRAEAGKMAQDVDRSRQRLREEVSKIESSMRLEIGLEKGRIRDNHAKQELEINET